MIIRHASMGAAALMVVLAAGLGAQSKPAPRTVELVGSDQMKYDVTTIQAKPGETLRVRVKTVGVMPKLVMAHNFVLLAEGTDAAAFANEAAAARATNFIPMKLKGQVLASTGLAGAGETVDVTFTVPKKPGKYQYICTFPGHFAAGMVGWLIVK